MQAENVLDVLNRAGELVDESVANCLDSSCIDLDIRGAQTAYDDELKTIWAKLISQEVSTGHARSKRTKALLEQMDVEDTNQLLSVLSCCLWTPVGPRSRPEPVPLLLVHPSMIHGRITAAWFQGKRLIHWILWAC